MTLYLTPACSGAAAGVRQLAVRANLHLRPHHRGHRGAAAGGGDRQGSVLGQEMGAHELSQCLEKAPTTSTILVKSA